MFRSFPPAFPVTAQRGAAPAGPACSLSTGCGGMATPAHTPPPQWPSCPGVFLLSRPPLLQLQVFSLLCTLSPSPRGSALAGGRSISAPGNLPAAARRSHPRGLSPAARTPPHNQTRTFTFEQVKAASLRRRKIHVVILELPVNHAAAQLCPGESCQGRWCPHPLSEGHGHNRTDRHQIVFPPRQGPGCSRLKDARAGGRCLAACPGHSPKPSPACLWLPSSASRGSLYDKPFGDENHTFWFENSALFFVRRNLFFFAIVHIFLEENT